VDNVNHQLGFVVTEVGGEVAIHVKLNGCRRKHQLSHGVGLTKGR